MFCLSRLGPNCRPYSPTPLFLAMAVVLFRAHAAFALITGGQGNETLRDPGWPAGAAVIFNNASRIAWWEGPPFGGGQWHAECRGDAKALSAVLADFAKLDAKSKRVVLHDGVGRSFWINPNGEPAKMKEAEIDWMFTVWQPDNWQRLRKLPLDLNPTAGRNAAETPPTQLDVYTGGNVSWSDVVIPEGLQITDERLESHVFKSTDGAVLEGAVVDMANKKPIVATMRLERVESQAKGGYRYTLVDLKVTDQQGHWVLKNAPAGWFRLVINAEGYVPRIAGYTKQDGRPCWNQHDAALSKAAPVAGRVTDGDGKPLEGVEVRLADAGSNAEGRYESPENYAAKTDADGCFRVEQFPAGNARVIALKNGYCQLGLGPTVTAPTSEVSIRMAKAAEARVIVRFGDKKRPPEYLVSIEPEGGAAVGKWSGASQIDANNQALFKNVPPGRYVLQGKPNPSSVGDESEPVTVILKGGETTEASLIAK